MMSNKAYSHQDIEDLISRERSINGNSLIQIMLNLEIDNKTISDNIIDDEIFRQHKHISEGGTMSPYISDLNEVEKAISVASIEDSARYSDVSILHESRLLLTQNCYRVCKNSTMIYSNRFQFLMKNLKTRCQEMDLKKRQSLTTL